MNEIVICYLLFSSVSIVPAVSVMFRRRNLFDPTSFLAIYWISYTSQLTEYFATGRFHTYVLGEHVAAVLVCAAVSCVLFLIGCALLGRVRGDMVLNGGDLKAATLARDVCLIGMSIGSVLLLAFALREGGLDFNKAWFRDNTSASVLSIYRVLIVATMLMSYLAVALDAMVHQYGRGRTVWIVLMVICQLGWCWLMSQRNVLLVLFAVAALYGGGSAKKLRFAALCIAALFSVAVQFHRTAVNQDRSIEARELQDFASKQFLPRLSASMTVFTNVMDLVPRKSYYFLGATYVTSLLTFIPADPFDARDESIANWFPANFYFQGETGVDFALDAEAYVNFGLAGPPILFLLLGCSLSLLQSKSTKYGFASIYYPTAAIIAFSAVRTNSQASLKMLVGTAVVCFLISWGSRALSARMRLGWRA